MFPNKVPREGPLVPHELMAFRGVKRGRFLQPAGDAESRSRRNGVEVPQRSVPCLTVSVLVGRAPLLKSTTKIDFPKKQQSGTNLF